MQFSKNSILGIANAIAVLLIIAYLAFNPKKEIAVINSQQLFDGFAMTKEMRANGEKEYQARKIILDSIYAKMELPQTPDAEKRALMDQLARGKEMLDEFSQSYSAELTTKIWERIHNYAREYAKEHHQEIIIGIDNKATVLYADPSKDITNALTQYINKKYEGLK